MREKILNTAELIVLCKAKICRIEYFTARGIDRLAAFEIAELSGLAHKLHDAAEREYESGRNTEESRAKAARDAKAGDLTARVDHIDSAGYVHWKAAK